MRSVRSLDAVSSGVRKEYCSDGEFVVRWDVGIGVAGFDVPFILVAGRQSKPRQ